MPYYGLVARLTGSLVASQAAIVLYHSVSDLPHALTVRTHAFERQIEYLGRHFEVVSLSTLATSLAGGCPRRKRPVAAVTFDDGYQDNYEIVRPILLRRGTPATFYVTTGFVGGTSPPAWGLPPLPMMAWSEVEALAADGFEIGSHTLTHPDLPSLTDEALDHELREPRRVLEARLKQPVASFAYPTGRYDGRVRDRVKAAGYSTAVTTHRRPALAGENPLELPRIGLGRHVGFSHFQALLSRALDTPLLLRL